jgi:hypothetical protein
VERQKFKFHGCDNERILFTWKEAIILNSSENGMSKNCQSLYFILFLDSFMLKHEKLGKSGDRTMFCTWVHKGIFSAIKSVHG